MKPIHLRAPVRRCFTLLLVITTLVAMGLAGAGPTSAAVKLEPVAGPQAYAQPTDLYPVTSISGFLGAGTYLQIDDLDDNPNTTADGNLYANNLTNECGAGPYSNMDDVNCPTDGEGDTWVDWNNVPNQGEGKYVVVDPSGNTDDSFSGTSTSSCLQPDHAAPQKEDILRIYLANNNEYFYFGEVDKAPQGDSRHVFVLTQAPPQIDDSAFCSGNGHQLYLKLTPGDKLILAVFAGSTATTPAAQLHDYVGPDDGYIYADLAADYSNTDLWSPLGSPTSGPGVANFAVNVEDVTDDLGFDNGTDPGRTFGEGAVALTDLGIGPCGGSYYINVITRSSGSGSGQSKDYVAIKYDFGSIAVTAKLTPSCEEKFGYSANATDSTSAPIAATYNWQCTNDETFSILNSQDGTQTVPPGTYSCNVTATATANSCNATSAQQTVTVYPTLGAEADLTPSCSLTIPYSANGTGGSGKYDYSWTFTAPGGQTVDPASSVNASGSITGSGVGNYSGNVTVTDSGRSDNLTCTATAGDTAQNGNLSVVVDAVPSCWLDGTGNTYGADVTGSVDGVSHSWSGDGVTFSAPSAASGNYDVEAAGTYTLTDLVTDLRTDLPPGECTATDNDTVQLFPLSATATLAGSCNLTFDYSSTKSGDIGDVSYAWTFTPEGVTPGTSDNAFGTASVDAPGGTYEGDLTVSDLRKDTSKNPISDYTCTATANSTAEVYGPIVLDFGPNDTLLGCPLSSTAITYSANVTGGDGNYTYKWTTNADNTTGCGASDNTCTVDSDADNYCALIDISLEVDDTFDLCLPQSDSGTVKKLTTVNAN